MGQQGHRKLPRIDGSSAASHAQDWRRDLRDAIVSRVVPRMAEPTGPDAAAALDDAGIFAEMALTGPVVGLSRALEAHRARGVAVEALMLDLLAPAARHLGDLWLEDRASFFDVTVGLGRLQALVRELDGCGGGPVTTRRVLLAPAPGEQHVFGLSIVGVFFRRAGWDVTFEPRIAFDDLLDLVGVERFAAVGLTAGGDASVTGLPAQIQALRRASLNPNVVLLAGGPAFLQDPDLAARIGVDAAPPDAAEAVREAERLLDRAAA